MCTLPVLIYNVENVLDISSALRRRKRKTEKKTSYYYEYVLFSMYYDYAGYRDCGIEYFHE